LEVVFVCAEETEETFSGLAFSREGYDDMRGDSGKILGGKGSDDDDRIVVVEDESESYVVSLDDIAKCPSQESHTSASKFDLMGSSAFFPVHTPCCLKDTKHLGNSPRRTSPTPSTSLLPVHTPRPRIS
jgi:hypothetical protein